MLPFKQMWVVYICQHIYMILYKIYLRYHHDLSGEIGLCIEDSTLLQEQKLQDL